MVIGFLDWLVEWMFIRGGVVPDSSAEPSTWRAALGGLQCRIQIRDDVFAGFQSDG